MSVSGKKAKFCNRILREAVCLLLRNGRGGGGCGGDGSRVCVSADGVVGFVVNFFLMAVVSCRVSGFGPLSLAFLSMVMVVGFDIADTVVFTVIFR